MQRLVDPNDLDQRQEAIEQVSNGAGSEATLNDRGALQDDVVVRDERLALEEEAEGLVRGFMVEVVVVEQRVHRRCVDKGRQSEKRLDQVVIKVG